MDIDPSKLRIVTYPADCLRAKARDVAEVTPQIREIADRMVDLMYEADGIGLAAPQVGLSLRMFVVDVPEDEEGDRSADSDPATATDGPVVCINPTISGFSRDLVAGEEGCLSLPRITGEVRRPSVCTVTALDENGREFSFSAAGLLARCLQHENDHLEGMLIIDKFDLPTRRRVKTQIEALEENSRVLG